MLDYNFCTIDRLRKEARVIPNPSQQVLGLTAGIIHCRPVLDVSFTSLPPHPSFENQKTVNEFPERLQ